MKTAKLLGIFCFIFTLGGTVPLQAEISGARDIVVATIDDLYSGISGEFESDEMLRASIEQSLEQHLTPVLDLNKFTKLILASHWKKASVEQRQRFTEILKAFLFRTLTKAIIEHQQILLSFKDDITVLEAKPGRTEERAVVTVVVQNGSQAPINLDFRMGFDNSRWSAYDVVVQNVSFAINYRAILNSEIKKNGIDNVVESFASKLDF